MKNTDLNLLAAALNALGKQAQVVGSRVVFQGGTFEGGRFNYQSTYWARVSQADAAKEVAKLKQAYSAEAVKATAKKWGWQIKETAPFTYEVVKR